MNIRLFGFLVLLISSSSIRAQVFPLKIENLSKYHFRLVNQSSQILEVYLGEEAGTEGLVKSFDILIRSSIVLKKSDYKKGTVIQILNRDVEPRFLWDYIDEDGNRLTYVGNVEFAIPLFKGALADQWKGGGNNLQYGIHLSYSFLPELRLSDKIYSRLYFSLDHEFYSHVLEYNGPVYLQSDVVQSPSRQLYLISEQDAVSLNQKYYSVGTFNRFYFLPGFYWDLGIRIPFIRNSLIDFTGWDSEVSDELLEPRGELVQPKLKNEIEFENSALDNIILFTKIGMIGQRTSLYSPLSSEVNFALSFQVMKNGMVPKSSYPIVFEDPDLPDNTIVPVSPVRGDKFYFIFSFHLGVPITR